MGLPKKLPSIKTMRTKSKSLIREQQTDTPWTTSMSDRPSTLDRSVGSNTAAPLYDDAAPEPTVAAFSPNQQTTASRNRNKSVLIHQKSALLVATPPQVTRALAYSHPFIVPLNCIAGLLTWTTGDAWQSFLLLAGFWFFTLYIDDVLRYAGPLVLVTSLILLMYGRRYSPLSSTASVKEKKKGNRGEADSHHTKSLEEILDALQIFTTRCDVLVDPFFKMTEFLSTQTTATSASTRPALTSMFIRLLAVTPIWYLLTLPPFYVVTTQRVILVVGTIGLTWHSRPARASRSILWRSRTVRILVSIITGLQFKRGPVGREKKNPPPLPHRAPAALINALARKGEKAGVRFTFAVYENQRRWVLLGFTANLLPNERQAWTDEHNNSFPDKEQFPLPETDSETTRWRWVQGSEWKIDPTWTDDTKVEGARDREGWTYYDNKWRAGSKADGYGKWTRRRRWIRDAELVEVTPEELAAAEADAEAQTTSSSEVADGTLKKKGWFGKRRLTNDKGKASDKAEVVSVSGSGASKSSRDGPEEDVHTPLRYRETQWDRSIGDGLAEGLS